MEKPTIIDMVNAPELSDEELYELYLEERDREIMAKLYKKYMALVFGVCMKFLHEKHAAQDATMEVFERLLQYEPANPVKRFRPYLYVMTKKYCLMKQRGEKVINIEITEADVKLAEEMHPIDKKEVTLKVMEKCIGELKEMQKVCVEHFYLQKKSYLQISKELKVTLNAVKSHIQNGKRNLKSCMEAAS